MTGDETLFSGITVEYDPKHGEVIEKFDGSVAQIVKVRAEMMEKAMQYAVIAELQKIGYTVIPPEEQT